MSSPGSPKWGTLWVRRTCMCPSLARVGWFRLRSTPGWRTVGAGAAALAAAAALAVARLDLTLGLALPGFFSVILAIFLSLLRRPGCGVAAGRQTLRSVRRP